MYHKDTKFSGLLPGGDAPGVVHTKYTKAVDFRSATQQSGLIVVIVSGMWKIANRKHSSVKKPITGTLMGLNCTVIGNLL